MFKHDGESENVSSLLQPPIRIALNKDTIYDCVSTIIQAYKNSQNSSHKKISNSPFWGFRHDSITKFGMELLIIFIQGTDINTMKAIIATKCLLQINGGHTAVDHDYDSHVSPLEYFKLRAIHHANKNDKEIHIETKNMPIANTGDRVALTQHLTQHL